MVQPKQQVEPNTKRPTALEAGLVLNGRLPACIPSIIRAGRGGTSGPAHATTDRRMRNHTEQGSPNARHSRGKCVLASGLRWLARTVGFRGTWPRGCGQGAVLAFSECQQRQVLVDWYFFVLCYSIVRVLVMDLSCSVSITAKG
jgi:hypothetical protein